MQSEVVLCESRALSQKTLGYSAGNSPAISIHGGEPWLMSYCWRTLSLYLSEL
jgi:hypothetical protein